MNVRKENQYINSILRKLLRSPEQGILNIDHDISINKAQYQLENNVILIKNEENPLEEPFKYRYRKKNIVIEGVNFQSVNLIEVTLDVDILFKYCKFDELRIENCQIEKNFAFEYCNVEKLKVKNSEFKKEIVFDHLRINGRSYIKNTRFKKDLTFSNCIFGEKNPNVFSVEVFDFQQTEVRKLFWIFHSVVNQRIDLKTASLNHSILFEETTFNVTPLTLGNSFENGLDYIKCRFNAKTCIDIQASFFFKHMKTKMKDSGNADMANKFHALDLGNIRQRKFIKHDKQSIGNYVIGYIRNILTLNNFYYIFSDYGYSIKRPFISLGIGYILYFTYLMFNGVSILEEKINTAWEEKIANYSVGQGNLNAIFIYTIKPIVRPFYRMEFLQPNSAFSLIVESLWYFLLIVFVGFTLTAIRKRFKH